MERAASTDMEEYISPADGVAPDSESTQREQTTPRQLTFGAALGEQRSPGPSPDNHNFDDTDPRRDTFSNEDAIAGQLDEVSRQQDFVTSTTRNFLDMSDPVHSAPGADFLLAAEYTAGGITYEAGETLDCNSFPILEAERNRRITEILQNLHGHRSKSSRAPSKTSSPRPRPSIGMTKESFVREENMRRWKEELFDASFYHTGEPNNPVRVRISKLRMADGRVFRKGQSIDQRFVSLHIDTTIGEAAPAESSRRLSRPLQSEEDDDLPFTSPERRDTAATARDLPIATDNVSLISEGSAINDERSSSAQPITGDPSDRSKPMSSPVHLYESEWILRVEMRTSKMDRTTLPQPLDVSSFHNHTVVEEGTRIEKKTPFVRGPANKYPFKSVTVRAYRVILTDLVAHWCRGATAERNVYLFSCWEPEFQNDFVRRWRAQCSASLSHPQRRDGHYIETYRKYNPSQFNALSAINLIYLVYICLLPLRKGKEGHEHECMYSAVKEVVNDEIGYLVERYSSYMDNGIMDFLSNYSIVTEAIFLAMSEIEYSIRVYEWWVDAGWFDVFPGRETASRSQCFTHILDTALAKFSTSKFDLYGLWHHWDISTGERRHRHRHVSSYIAAKRSKQQLQRAYFEPLHSQLPSILNLPKAPFTVREHQARADGSKDHATHVIPTSKSRSFNTPRAASRPTPDKARLNNISSDAALQDDIQEDTTSEDTKEQPAESDTPTASTLSPSSVDLDSPDVIARLAALVSSHMRTEGTTPTKPPHAASSPSPWPSSVTPAKPTEKAPLDKRACYNMLITGTCSRSDRDCMYSHDPKVVNEAKTQCMARWKGNQKTPLNNMTTLDRFFPKQDGVDDSTGYSDSSREAIYEYFDSAVSAVIDTTY